jgi:two-component system, response regulator YesN
MMSSVLIVDDEAYAVAGIKAALDWGVLGVDELFTAFNVVQAREILEYRKVEIVLCDIEMPSGSGLDLLEWMRASGLDAKVVFLTCHSDFNYAKRALQLQGFDYLVKPVPAAELRRTVSRALAAAEPGGAPPDAAPGTPSPADSDTAPAPSAEWGAEILPEMSLWVILLKSGGEEKVRYELRSYIYQMPQSVKSDKAFLQRFLLDFQQVVSAVLRSRGMNAHGILEDAASSELFQKATSSYPDLLHWVDFSLDFLRKSRDEYERGRSHFGRAAEFIAKNLDGEITCETIAARVSLNSDYLTRLFKKETGLSVSAYILREKMRLAAELLDTSGLSISEISERLGYMNPASFSLSFRKRFGKSPHEYRQARERGSAIQPPSG